MGTPAVSGKSSLVKYDHLARLDTVVTSSHITMGWLGCWDRFWIFVFFACTGRVVQQEHKNGLKDGTREVPQIWSTEICVVLFLLQQKVLRVLGATGCFQQIICLSNRFGMSFETQFPKDLEIRRQMKHLESFRFVLFHKARVGKFHHGVP